jgi:N-acetylmuramoyl-L-alanine amidase
MPIKIAISSGHGAKVSGANYYINEVDEARRVVSALAEALREHGHEVTEIHDDTSDTQDENLDWLVSEHNATDRDLDLSIHFNSADPQPVEGFIGTECFYQTQTELAAKISAAISDSLGIPDRGAKYGSFYWLSHTNRPACLVEVCFVMARGDVDAYEDRFEQMIEAVASIKMTETQVTFSGTVSHFGGILDSGVAYDEDLAWWWDWDQVVADGADHLFLSEQPPHTTGLARRLDAEKAFYVACRWNYDVTPKSMLADQRLTAMVHAPKTGRSFTAQPCDWGPHEEKTGRAADISPALMRALFGTDDATDELVQVTYPAK